MQASDMKIREVEVDDMEELLGLLHQLSPQKEKTNKENLEETLRDIIDSECQEIYILGEGGTATLLVQENLSHGGRPYGHIENVVVDSEHKGQGLGEKIVTHVINKARGKGCYKAVLDCKKDLVPFYEKCGMKKSGEVQMRTNFR